MLIFEKFCRFVFFDIIVRPLVLLVLGVHVRNQERLPTEGPAIVVANHNSHLDTLVLMTILPRSVFNKLRPLAAADYFLRGKFLSWFSLSVLRIIPIKRSGRAAGEDPLADSSEALSQGDVLILFPEGSRGEPGEMQKLKSGVARLAERHPDVPVYPLFMAGLERALPKGEAMLVPFFCDVFVAEPMQWQGDKNEFMATLQEKLGTLQSQFGRSREWSD